MPMLSHALCQCYCNNAKIIFLSHWNNSICVTAVDVVVIHCLTTNTSLLLLMWLLLFLCQCHCCANIVMCYLTCQCVTAAVDVAAVIFTSMLLSYQHYYVCCTNAIIIMPMCFYYYWNNSICCGCCCCCYYYTNALALLLLLLWVLLVVLLALQMQRRPRFVFFANAHVRTRTHDQSEMTIFVSSGNCFEKVMLLHVQIKCTRVHYPNIFWRSDILDMYQGTFRKASGGPKSVPGC